MQQIKFLEILRKNDLRPHHWDMLLSLKGLSDASFNKNGDSFVFLINNGWVDDKFQPTSKSDKLLNSIEYLFRARKKKSPEDMLGEDYIAKLKAYNEIFPKCKLPHGSPARTSITTLVDKMVWAFENIEGITWDKVYETARAYVAEFKAKNYEHMRTSGYFIKKEDKNKGITSDLATYLENGFEAEKKPIIKFKVL